MPIYTYKCESCGHSKDVLQKMSDVPLTECPECGACAFKKQLTAAGFQLKGSGWYATDFKGGAAPVTAEAKPATDALEAGELLELRAITGAVPVSQPMLEYIVALVEATHDDKRVRYGLSPRGAQALLNLARAFALLNARAFINREDVLRALPLAATHRVIMGFEAELEGVQVGDVLKGVLERVK